MFDYFSFYGAFTTVMTFTFGELREGLYDSTTFDTGNFGRFSLYLNDVFADLSTDLTALQFIYRALFDMGFLLSYDGGGFISTFFTSGYLVFMR